MTSIRRAYLRAATSTLTLLRDPAIAEAWAGPSALVDFTVGGLAGHLAGQVLMVGPLLRDAPTANDADKDADEYPLVPLLEHYARAQWVHADLDDEVNVNIRRRGEHVAADGADALIAQVERALAELPEALETVTLDQQVRPASMSWRLRLDDYLTARMMEIAVHSDDLAFSVGIATPVLPPAVIEPVLALLSDLAVRRHGPTAMLRALSRAERAPRSIAAF